MEARARREHKRGTETQLFDLMKHHDKPRLTSGIWERALDEGDALAESVIRRAVRALGAGIASVVNLLDPEVVILGGGMGVRLGQRLMPHIEDYANRNIFVSDRPPPIRVAELGDLGGAIGASLLIEE
jgi:glucokinase